MPDPAKEEFTQFYLDVRERLVKIETLLTGHHNDVMSLQKETQSIRRDLESVRREVTATSTKIAVTIAVCGAVLSAIPWLIKFSGS